MPMPEPVRASLLQHHLHLRLCKSSKTGTPSHTRAMYDYNDLLGLSCSTNSDIFIHSPSKITESSASSLTFPAQPTVYVDELSRDTSVYDAVLGMNPEVIHDDYSYCSMPLTPSLSMGSTNHSIQRKEFNHPIISYHQESEREILNWQSRQMRKVLHTGHVEGDDYCAAEETAKVVPYNTEERRERIAKYRSKRNHRNFSKKITYACRKTLADSRPRIRGRFARIEDTEECRQAQWSPMEEDDDAWINYLNSFYAD